jgi:hypothetical protein
MFSMEMVPIRIIGRVLGQEGTLPYISPEQTGRMNRSLDYRADGIAEWRDECI